MPKTKQRSQPSKPQLPPDFNALIKEVKVPPEHADDYPRDTFGEEGLVALAYALDYRYGSIVFDRDTFEMRMIAYVEQRPKPNRATLHYWVHPEYKDRHMGEWRQLPPGIHQEWHEDWRVVWKRFLVENAPNVEDDVEDEEPFPNEKA